jgi:broad specificity phosphatase PhoE
LREISCGELDGMALGEVQQRFPELWKANLRQDDFNFCWPGGESYRGFRKRCLETVQAIARRHRGGSVALVTHAGVITQIVGFLHGANPAEWARFRPGNTGLTEVMWESGDLISFDDRSHLPHELS